MPSASPNYPAPLQSTGSLAKLGKTDLTPSIGTEFHPSVKIVDLLDAEAHPTAIRDLAIIVSQRGVVFFREQHDLTVQQQRTLVDRLGRETGRPAEAGLHIHPTHDLGTFGKETAGNDVQNITSDAEGARQRLEGVISSRASNFWHSDVTFEPHPSDYAVLRLDVLPKVGGDTLWASAYQAYDRLSPAFQEFLSTLTATHVGEPFFRFKQAFREPRGHPENKGQHLSASHPVIRTNPVTGWKGLFVNRTFTKRINELNKDESDNLLSYLFEHISQNHDLQVRFRWEKGSVAIWDNRSTFHSVTADYGFEKRHGERIISVGERPYYDPLSSSRAAALEAAGGGEGAEST